VANSPSLALGLNNSYSISYFILCSWLCWLLSSLWKASLPLRHAVLPDKNYRLQIITRSSASYLLSVPRDNLSFGVRAFRVAAPKIWNSIPLHIRQSQTHSSFRRHLKTYYFLSAHLAPLAAPVMRPDSLPRLWRYINLLLTYLLTYKERNIFDDEIYPTMCCWSFWSWCDVSQSTFDEDVHKNNFRCSFPVTVTFDL